MPISGYTTTYEQLHGRRRAGGGNATCTITNDDNAPQARPRSSIVVNDNGGTAVATDWTLSADRARERPSAPSRRSTRRVTVQAGTYALTESGLAGYTRAPGSPATAAPSTEVTDGHRRRSAQTSPARSPTTTTRRASIAASRSSSTTTAARPSRRLDASADRPGRHAASDSGTAGHRRRPPAPTRCRARRSWPATQPAGCSGDCGRQRRHVTVALGEHKHLHDHQRRQRAAA